MPNACSPMYKNTNTAPIKPDAKPIGTPIDIRSNNPTISISESDPISILFQFFRRVVLFFFRISPINY